VRLSGLNTPCAVVDLPVLLRNCLGMRERAERLGVKLRPHVKTHKCVEVARLQHGGAVGPVTVSTMAEARAFAAAGFGDLTYAVPVPFDALPEAVEMVARGVRLNLLFDSAEALREIEAAGASRDARSPLFLKVDCGYHRAGVDPEREESVALARAAASSPHVEFRGILTHSGQAYRCISRAGAAAVAEHERAVMAAFAGRLREAGVPVGEVSVGSTPACTAAERYDGVTEIRPGNYAFFDAFQAAVGSCDLRDALAFTVLATVVGAYPERGQVVLNAGALALSKDPGPIHVDASCGFGVVCDLSGSPLKGIRLDALSQEHGEATLSDRALLDRLQVGSKVRVVPNHSCLAAACFDRYHVIGDGEVVDEWRPARGW
jgi:D-serine deaminase-like pyridoxal phosphate-dependent protein